MVIKYYMSAKQEMCLQLEIGSCLGCNILTLIINRARWKLIPMDTAAADIARQYCPTGAVPQTQYIQNREASSGMGQRNEENLDFDPADKKLKGGKTHGHY